MRNSGPAISSSLEIDDGGVENPDKSPAMGIIAYKSFVNLRADPREIPEKLGSFCAPCAKKV